MTPTVKSVQKCAAGVFGVAFEAVAGHSRKAKFARPRQVAMFLMRQMTSHSLPKLGQLFVKDHTTILHAIRRVNERMADDLTFCVRVHATQFMVEWIGNIQTQCQFVPQKVQPMTVIYQGQKITIPEAMRRSQSPVAVKTVHRRLSEGWPLMRALTFPSTYHDGRWNTRPLSRPQTVGDE